MSHRAVILTTQGGVYMFIIKCRFSFELLHLCFKKWHRTIRRWWICIIGVSRITMALFSVPSFLCPLLQVRVMILVFWKPTYLSCGMHFFVHLVEFESVCFGNLNTCRVACNFSSIQWNLRVFVLETYILVVWHAISRPFSGIWECCFWKPTYLSCGMQFFVHLVEICWHIIWK